MFCNKINEIFYLGLSVFFMMTTQMYSWNALRESVFEASLEVSFSNDKTKKTRKGSRVDFHCGSKLLASPLLADFSATKSF